MMGQEFFSGYLKDAGQRKESEEEWWSFESVQQVSLIRQESL